MRRLEAVALLLGPTLIVSAVSPATRLDDDHMSATDVRQFCSSYRLLLSADADRPSWDEWARAARLLLVSASDNLKDDVRLAFYIPLRLEPVNKSGADAERAGANLQRAARRRC